ncbi:hypothetical protein BOTBODRAFT_191087 [Botryobasidium botryosum FD-172 SS1]|uniref:F-box domain-containing protein n=1 Tax=Botryobasidium botryosum (strain FD-172 SS1) TaxID=930990 RepID=A0A067MD06_BOTB1|nr:hypothetical protein BOTBODRAFT_191087 [Botryobasidium botryosum FD-172 SS1]
MIILVDSCMMLLAQLDNDILTAICSFLTTRRSLLSLARTCRAFHAIIIPTFLYARLHFAGSPYVDTAAELRLRSLFDAVRRRESVGRAVRHLVIHSTTGADSLWGDSLSRMPNMRSLTISRRDPSPVLLKAIPTMPHLHTLSLKSCSSKLVELLRGIRFRHLDLITLEWYNLTPDSAFGEILLYSRDTLNELTLSNLTWCFESDIPSGQSSPSHDGRDPVWPRITRLHLGSVFRDNTPLNLAYHFPSVVCLRALNRPYGLDHPCNRPFFAGLRSLEGQTEDLKLAESLGAMLRRAHISIPYIVTESAFDNLPLQSTLQSLTLYVNLKFPSNSLKRLAVSCPKVKFLGLHLEVESSIGPLLETIFSHLSDLPLECVHIHWGYVGKPHKLLVSSGDSRDVAMLVRLVPRIIPSLHFISFTSPGFKIYLRRSTDARGVAGLGGFTKMSEEDGLGLLQYYEWRWMDQAEERVDSS